MGKRRYLAFGKEPTMSQAIPGYIRTWPVIPTGSEMCETCGAVRPRTELRSDGNGADGEPWYVCADGCSTALT